MNSPRGSARTPARPGRDGSISPQLLDPGTDEHASIPSTTDDVDSGITQAVIRGIRSPGFSRLPPIAIQRILWSVDANSFASLAVLNREWRQQSQKVELYAHHLSRCPSYALSNSIISGPFRRNDLSRLRTKFADEVRRNLFDAFLCPRRTLINLVSLNANSSAAFPTGEAFRFEFSPNARTILALSSSRIYVIDTVADPPAVVRQLKTLRRPLSASVTDDGSLLAVLSSKHQVNIYGLTPTGVQHLQVVVLDNPPKIIAIAHEGTVLAASYEAGIEVFSLAANALTTDRRAVRSEAVDTLTFSGDGSMLVGSSLSLDEPNAVVISAPFYTENDPDLSPREIHSRMWTTQILFPQISSVCSHVTLLPGHLEGDACWLFAFDHSLMSYRAVRTDDTRAGVAYFLSPPGADRFDIPVPTISPTASACGTLAIAAFEGAGLWLYGVPERLDLTPDMAAVVERQNERQRRSRIPLTSATGNAEPLMAYSPSNSASDYSIEDDSLASKVDWRQSLFVKCKNIHGLPGQTAARWVEHVDNSITQSSKRLIIVAPGGVSLGDELGDEGMPVDGSRMCLLDFNYAPSAALDRTLTIEVGEADAELLREHTGSLATEVAMERRRTIRAIPTLESARVPLGRSVTSVSPSTAPFFEDGFRRGSVSSPSSPTEQSSSRGPQIHASNSLQRSATASGFRHARYPPRPPLGSPQALGQSPGGYQRFHQDGRPLSEDSWETPPPPYIGAHSLVNPQYGQPSLAGEQTVPSALLPGQPPLPTHPLYRPYRAASAERTNASLDTLMSSHALPDMATMNHYQELISASRSPGPSEPSLPSPSEPFWNTAMPPDLRMDSQPFFPSTSDSQGRRHVRPGSHHGSGPHGWSGAQRSFSSPISPTVSAVLKDSIQEQNEVDAAVLVSEGGGLSLTGANLQNRLNHPVPPLPNTTESFTPLVGRLDAQYEPVSQRAIQTPQNSHAHPSVPTLDQMASLHRRLNPSEGQHLGAVKNTSFVHRTPGPMVPPSPPRGAWGAAGVPGSPSFHQARNVPNGFSRSRSNSRESQISNLASTSAPNLLAQRPKYGRLDTIDSINDIIRGNETSGVTRSRAHSMVQAAVVTNAEPSAYHETSRSGPGQGVGKYGKRFKKVKEESTRKGSKCSVM